MITDDEMSYDELNELLKNLKDKSWYGRESHPFGGSLLEHITNSHIKKPDAITAERPLKSEEFVAPIDLSAIYSRFFQQHSDLGFPKGSKHGGQSVIEVPIVDSTGFNNYGRMLEGVSVFLKDKKVTSIMPHFS